MNGLEGRTGLVTGASRGIGKAIARSLAARGVRLVLASRGGAELEAVAEETDGTPLSVDLEAADGPQGLAEGTRARLGGPPDLLVNAAGFFPLSRMDRVQAADLDRALALNLRAPFLLVRAFLPGMLQRGSGKLVHLGSVAGRRAFPENGAYAASKYGLRGMHEVLSLELAGTGVTSLLVEAGAVDTGAWDPYEARLGSDLPARREMLRPEEVADALLEALRSPAAGAGSDVLVLPP